MKKTVGTEIVAGRAPDRVEKVLLGVIPDDAVDSPVRPSDFMRDAREDRLEVVRRYLARQPELRAELEAVVRAGPDDRRQWGRFLGALAERRAQVLSRAQLDHFSETAPRVIQDFEGELTRYLVEMEGFGPSAASAREG